MIIIVESKEKRTFRHRGFSMKCKVAEKLIAPFIAQNMDINELEDFLIHMQECDSCKEELSIQYLVAVGMHRIEEGSTFDLQRELDGKLLSEGKKIRMRRIFFRSLYTIEVLAILTVIIGTIIAIYF